MEPVPGRPADPAGPPGGRGPPQFPGDDVAPVSREIDDPALRSRLRPGARAGEESLVRIIASSSGARKPDYSGRCAGRRGLQAMFLAQEG